VRKEKISNVEALGRVVTWVSFLFMPAFIGIVFSAATDSDVYWMLGVGILIYGVIYYSLTNRLGNYDWETSK